MNLKNSQTFKNLARTYAGECQARTRYEFMEYGARSQGFKALADIIDDIAYNEFNHARMFYSFIQTADKQTITNIHIDAGYPFKEKWDLMENLRLASEDETDEATKIYPEFARVAEQEGFKDIAGLYRNVIEVEKQHIAILSELYTQMKNNTMYSRPTPVVWKCSDCGYAQKAMEAFKCCPLCHAKQGAVLLKIDALSKPSASLAVSQNATASKVSAGKSGGMKTTASSAKSTTAKPSSPKTSSAKPSASSATKKPAVKPVPKMGGKPTSTSTR
ncbi:MAG: hypothetical protein FWD49_00195 [Firmicutes bacterium]|nr:hypothetical protein [Bacillota bacterium]